MKKKSCSWKEIEKNGKSVIEKKNARKKFQKCLKISRKKENVHVFYFKKHNFPTQIKLIFSQILTLAPDIKQYPIREKNRKKCR